MKRSALTANSRGEDIVHAAAKLFREFGFNGTSIVDIADAVNLPKGGLYNYINSKEELLYEIITRGIRQFLPALREIKGSKGDPREKFRRAVYTNVFWLAESRDFIGVFLQDKKSLSDRHYKEYIGYRDEVENTFKDIIRQGMKQGVFRKTDIDLITFAVLGMCNGVAQWYHPEGALKAEEVAAFYADVAEHMVCS
jgi:TetR/AcrR family transcriptional regulator, cholesterol catabolism regulator